MLVDLKKVKVGDVIEQHSGNTAEVLAIEAFGDDNNSFTLSLKLISLSHFFDQIIGLQFITRDYDRVGTGLPYIAGNPDDIVRIVGKVVDKNNSQDNPQVDGYECDDHFTTAEGWMIVRRNNGTIEHVKTAATLMEEHKSPSSDAEKFKQAYQSEYKRAEGLKEEIDILAKKNSALEEMVERQRNELQEDKNKYDADRCLKNILMYRIGQLLKLAQDNPAAVTAFNSPILNILLLHHNVHSRGTEMTDEEYTMIAQYEAALDAQLNSL